MIEGWELGFMVGICVGSLVKVGCAEGNVVGSKDGVTVGVSDIVGLLEGAILT